MEIQTVKSSNNLREEWIGEFKLLGIMFYYKDTVKAVNTIK